MLIADSKQSLSPFQAVGDYRWHILKCCLEKLGTDAECCQCSISSAVQIYKYCNFYQQDSHSQKLLVPDRALCNCINKSERFLYHLHIKFRINYVIHQCAVRQIVTINSKEIQKESLCFTTLVVLTSLELHKHFNGRKTSQFQNLLDKCSGCDWGKGNIWNICIWQPDVQSHQFCIATVRLPVPDGEKINMKLQIVTTCMCAHPPSMETTNLPTGAALSQIISH